MGLLSPEEKIYVVHGAEQGVRTDGRQRFQYRPIEIETNLIPSAMGSARVKIGNTDVVACVKANTFTPPATKPNEGQLSLLIHFSGVADPGNEGRASEQLRDRYTHSFNRLYSTVKLKKWCIVEKLKCWKFTIDVCVLSLNGNLYDAVGLAVRSALATSEVPIVKVTNQDKGEMEFSISEDPSDTWTPDVNDIPIFITASKIGDSLILDASSQEELCVSFSCVVACTAAGKVLFSMKSGAGSLCQSTLVALIKSASLASISLNKEFDSVLAKSKSTCPEIIGYL